MTSRITRRIAIATLASCLLVNEVCAQDEENTPTEESLRRSVVKIFSTQSPPNMFRPWEITPPQEATGSGVVIEGGRILTNAHVVNYAQQVYVQPYESSEKLDATIEYLSADCDLATLTIDEPEAIDGIKPAQLADALPALKDKVNVLGYPVGGDTLSVTEGVVSRIEWLPYNYTTRALRIQVDAAINPGNSGGPAVINGKVTGIVFSRLQEGDNIGYLIPAEVIRHFLNDWAEDGRFDGFPMLDVVGATLENPSLRNYLGLDRETTGIVIHRVNREDLAGKLEPWDVVTACNGVDIDNLGMVSLTSEVRVKWGHLITKQPAGSSVRLSIIRKGQPIEVEVPTVTERDTLIQRMKGDRPTYFIYGGLVFSPVTSEMIRVIPANYYAVLGAQAALLTQRIQDYREKPDEELVVLCSPILPHKMTKGYSVTVLSVVTHVNDQPVLNLRHLITLIKENTEPFIVFRFERDREEKIVLDPELVKEFDPEILRNNVIPAACSENLRDIWP